MVFSPSRGQGWHGGPTPLGALRGVTAEQARWQPTRGRRSIWSLTLHIAYWNYAVRRLLDGSERGAFPRAPSNWPRRRRRPDERSWTADVALLREEHARLAAGCRRRWIPRSSAAAADIETVDLRAAPHRHRDARCLSHGTDSADEASLAGASRMTEGDVRGIRAVSRRPVRAGRPHRRPPSPGPKRCSVARSRHPGQPGTMWRKLAARSARAASQYAVERVQAQSYGGNQGGLEQGRIHPAFQRVQGW